MMTLDGTNTWVLREPGGRSVVIDPGPEIARHLDAVADVAGDVAAVLLTHGHLDHSEAARSFAERVGCGVRALDPRHRSGSEGLGDGDVVEVDGLEVHVVGTPGHTSDSLSFVLPQERAVLTGDTVLGRGTTVVAHPDGKLGAYLDSLQRLHACAEAGDRHRLARPRPRRRRRPRRARLLPRPPRAAARPGARRPRLDRSAPRTRSRAGRRDGLRRRRPGALGRRRAQRPRPDRLPRGDPRRGWSGSPTSCADFRRGIRTSHEVRRAPRTTSAPRRNSAGRLTRAWLSGRGAPAARRP